MTCIVGLVHRDRVWMGGDSAGMDDRYALQIRLDRKVFRRGDFLMGFTTSFPMGNLLQHLLSPPSVRSDEDLHQFMCTRFIDAVRQCLKDGGFASLRDSKESGGCFLVGYQGRLFQIDDDYHVGENAGGMAAVGSADQVALGSLFSTEGRAPKARVLTALAAAERFCGGVRAPFHVEMLSAVGCPSRQITP